jgi:hypothetical protein
MDQTLPNTTITTDATLFREEADRARRYAAAMTDKNYRPIEPDRRSL